MIVNTLKHLAFILKVDINEIEMITNNIDKFYYQNKKIKKDKADVPIYKNGELQIRTLYPSIKRLKIIQRRINKNILQKLEMPDYAFGGIKGKDNITNAKKHQGKKFIFTTDLKNFFPSIDHHRIFDTFRSFGFSPTVCRMLTKLTTYKGMLPQGTPTSPLLANFAFVATGNKLKDFASKHKLTFTSFIDDLTFSASEDFKIFAGELIKIIQLDGFKISHKKTNYKTKNPVVTGIIVKNNNLDLTYDFKIKLIDTNGKTESQIAGLNHYANRVLYS